MQEPFENPPAASQGDDGDPAPVDEIVAAAEPEAGLDPALSHSSNQDAPLREIAHAFRLNAEALHTLKQMQGDLARSVKRGDRSELVLQSTRALNETFRNLTAVQRELLGRLHRGEGAGRGPLIPLMLLGLLVVLLGGVYVILDAVEKRPAAGPGMDPAEIARRERDSWKEGRREGAQQSDREIERLREALEEAKARRQAIQNQLDAKAESLTELERGKRAAEVERDEFAGQVRKAQTEIVAKKALEDTIGSLRLQLDAANKVAAQAEHDLELQRSRNAFLRERMADMGMGFTEDDPPWRPGTPAGIDPATGKPIKDLVSKKDDERSPLLNLVRRPKSNAEALARALAEREAANGPGTPGNSRVPPPAPAADAAGSRVPPPAPAADPRTPPRNLVQPGRPSQPQPSATAPRGAAYGGDATGARPPAALRRPAEPVDREAKSVDRVRAHLNGLLRRPTGGGGAGWTVTRIRGVAADHLGGVIMQRYDASGRMIESIEAQDVRIAVTRDRKRVEFVFRDGLRYDRGVRAPLPPRGMPVVMAQGQDAAAWAGSSLRVIKMR